jgi:glycosyltransferase involved in cell wall biosynthesis
LSVTNVITNGVDLEFFKPAVSQEAGSGLVIGSVTNFNWKDKAFGLKLLIDSIKALEMQDLPPTGSKLVIVGNGIYRNEIMDYAGSLALKNVFFRTAKYEEMPSVYNEFDIYVHASGQEGFSVSILEALACGKPVVTSSRITELTSLKAVQIVQSREEMISALRTLITDVEMRRKLGVVARREVENYSLRTIANQYLKLYNTR